MNVACSLRVLFKSRALTVLCLQDIPRMINYEAQCKMNRRKSSACKIKANLLRKSNGCTNSLLTRVKSMNFLSVSIKKKRWTKCFALNFGFFSTVMHAHPTEMFALLLLILVQWCRTVAYFYDRKFLPEMNSQSWSRQRFGSPVPLYSSCST